MDGSIILYCFRRSISRKDLVDYISTHYTAPRMVLAAAGGTCACLCILVCFCLFVCSYLTMLLHKSTPSVIGLIIKNILLFLD